MTSQNVTLVQVVLCMIAEQLQYCAKIKSETYKRYATNAKPPTPVNSGKSQPDAIHSCRSRLRCLLERSRSQVIVLPRVGSNHRLHQRQSSTPRLRREAPIRRADARERTHRPRRRRGHLNILWAAWDEFVRQVGDVDAFGRVVVRCRDDLDDFVAGELQRGDVAGGAGHEVAVEHAQDGFVRDDEEVVLLALQLEDDGLEADREVVVGLRGTSVRESCSEHVDV